MLKLGHHQGNQDNWSYYYALVAFQKVVLTVLSSFIVTLKGEDLLPSLIHQASSKSPIGILHIIFSVCLSQKCKLHDNRDFCLFSSLL